MYASYQWLRELCPFDAHASRVAEALTARGLTVDGVQAQGADMQFDIDVPANRPDCLGHRGLARELAAAFGVALRAAAAAAPDRGAPVAQAISVQIDASELCGRYSARVVRGVKVAASPAWVVQRLETCGLRSINNVVDISNLVMLETGNPIHFFDLPKVAGARIVVRRANRGETLTTLDGETRTLDEEMLVIADGQRGVALAGVMGGAATEIGAATTDVLIEAAWFAPHSIRRTARTVGMITDASQRFARGVDPAGVCAAQQMAVRLLVELASGVADAGVVDVHPARTPLPTLELRRTELPRLLGYTPHDSETVAALGALGLEPQQSADGFRVTVPSWRVDLNREADLVEEIARHLGYDRIPVTTAGLPQVDAPLRSVDRGEATRDFLARAGFHEAFGYAMIAAGEDEPFVEPGTPAPTALEHPIVETMAFLRRAILPGLLRAVDLNLRRGTRHIRLFEVGRVFHPRPEEAFPLEPLRVGIAWSGSARELHWSEAAPDVTLFDLIGQVEATLAHLAPGVAIRRRAGGLPGQHPGLCVHWLAEGQTLAWAGLLHPDLQAALPHPVWVAEIDLDRLPGPASAATPCYRPIPRLGAVERDIAVVLPPRRSWSEVYTALCAIKSPVPASIVPIDRYEGAPLAPGSAAVTVRVRLQPDSETLTDSTIESYRLELVRCLTGALGLEIRG